MKSKHFSLVWITVLGQDRLTEEKWKKIDAFLNETLFGQKDNRGFFIIEGHDRILIPVPGHNRKRFLNHYKLSEALPLKYYLELAQHGNADHISALADIYREISSSEQGVPTRNHMVAPVIRAEQEPGDLAGLHLDWNTAWWSFGQARRLTWYVRNILQRGQRQSPHRTLRGQLVHLVQQRAFPPPKYS